MKLPPNFSLTRYRRWTSPISLVVVVASLISLTFTGLNLGLDFTGGAVVELRYEQPADIEELRDELQSKGIEAAEVVFFGDADSVLIRLPRLPEADALAAVQRASQIAGNPFEVVRQDSIGPSVGEELREQGGLSLLLALGVILVYVAFRFQSKFGLAAIVALAHDVTIILGAFSLFRWEFDLSVLAALLAVIGYSLNDTIVVADRVRENLRAHALGGSVEEVVDTALKSTLSRTLVTSMTTLLVLLSLLIFGGPSLRGFSIALTIGVIVGTYSSIYVSVAALLAMNIKPKDVALPEKEGDLPDNPLP